MRILVPLDFSETSFEAATVAARVAHDIGATVDLLHVWNPPTPPLVADFPSAPYSEESARDTARLLMADLRSREGLPTGRDLIAVGSPGQTIVDAASSDRVDMIVMGTHGRSGVTRLLLGSVAAHVLRHADCPVVTVRPGHPRAERSAAP